MGGLRADEHLPGQLGAGQAGLVGQPVQDPELGGCDAVGANGLGDGVAAVPVGLGDQPDELAIAVRTAGPLLHRVGCTPR
jgi:hypothetical protein